MSSSGSGDFDLGALSAEDQERVRREFEQLSGSVREFTDRDVAPGDSGTPTSN